MKGIATSGVCPRAGYIRLTSKIGATVVVKSTCKTWGCKQCRERVKSRVLSMMSYGCLMLGECWLITVTYKTDGCGSVRNAASVAKDWAALLSRLRQSPDMKSVAWFRVVELTKLGQPHLHLIVGGIGNGPWKEIQRRWREYWLEITGDSYIVDVRPVLGAYGAAAYLGKYLVKGLMDREELESLGFKRRWSCSNNWPRADVVLQGTDQGRWARVQFIGGMEAGAEKLALEAEDSASSPLLDRVGDPVAVAYERKMVVKAKRAKLKGVIKGVKNNWKALGVQGGIVE